MILNQAILPPDHPNRRRWRLEAIAGYIVHSTANLRPGTGDEWHGRYFGRQWMNTANGPMESDGKTPFRTGCTHLAADADSLTQYLPFDEYAPGAGDRPRPYDEMDKGQRPLARLAYDNRQNWRTLQIEICEGGGWSKAAEANARDWIIEDMTGRGLRLDLLGSIMPLDIVGPPKPGHVYLLRHHDLTGKDCPSYMVRHVEEWRDFVRYVAAAVNGGQP